jgi:hypothetical protein
MKIMTSQNVTGMVISDILERDHLTRQGATSGAGTAYPFGAPEFIPVFSGVCVTQSLVLYVCFLDRCLSFCAFSFGHCAVYSSLNYGF